MSEQSTVCVDLDGVLASHDYKWYGLEHFGEPIPGAVEFTKRLAESAEIIIYTCRCSEHHDSEATVAQREALVRGWLDKHGFSYHTVWVGQGKPVCRAYCDDRAVSCRPQDNPNAFAEAHAAITRLM